MLLFLYDNVDDVQCTQYKMMYIQRKPLRAAMQTVDISLFM